MRTSVVVVWLVVEEEGIVSMETIFKKSEWKERIRVKMRLSKDQRDEGEIINGELLWYHIKIPSRNGRKKGKVKP